MTNGGINNVGALRLSMSQSAALTSVRLTDAQIDAIMRCSTLELATTRTGGVLSDVSIFTPWRRMCRRIPYVIFSQLV